MAAKLMRYLASRGIRECLKTANGSLFNLRHAVLVRCDRMNRAEGNREEEGERPSFEEKTSATNSDFSKRSETSRTPSPLNDRSLSEIQLRNSLFRRDHRVAIKTGVKRGTISGA